MQEISNHTEPSAKKLHKRNRYIAKHRPYVDYLLLLLDRASLPASTYAQPNITSMGAMVDELRLLNPDVAELNSIVLGRFLHRVLPTLLTWHGGQYSARYLPKNILISLETTIYRFPEVGRSRAALEAFGMCGIEWPNDFDQWQWVSCDDEL
jgi:hypothetical protein